MGEKYNFCFASGGGPKKHPCPDCYFCQHCSDDRCSVCLREQRAAKKKTQKKVKAKKPKKKRSGDG